MTAAAIDPDAVTARNAPVDASIMKEVEKAEKEQVYFWHLNAYVVHLHACQWHACAANLEVLTNSIEIMHRSDALTICIIVRDRLG